MPIFAELPSWVVVIIVLSAVGRDGPVHGRLTGANRRRSAMCRIGDDMPARVAYCGPTAPGRESRRCGVSEGSCILLDRALSRDRIVSRLAPSAPHTLTRYKNSARSGERCTQ